MKLQKNTKLVMIGDSITDAGRARPIGEGEGALGAGYVSLVNALLGAAHPEKNIQVLNMGIGGNTVRDLAGRWQTDALDLKPAWLSVMIGINDVWRQFDSQRPPEEQITLGEYETTLNDLITRAAPSVDGLILITPYLVEPNRADPMRVRLDDYIAIVRSLAEKHSAVFVDTQGAFDAAIPAYYPRSFAADRVHPNLTGHMVIARAFLNAIGFEW